MPDRTEFVNLNVRVPSEVMDDLKNLKMATGKSITHLVVEALREYIEARSREVRGHD